ncbi:MAG TPA: IS110 family transposase [Pseudomonadales bacterium]|nr:IS110 family transposase [Pseudomonadales bacterium]
MNTTTIGVDLAKSVFQVSVSNQAGRIVARKRLSRSQFDRFLANHEPATLVMETCGSAHHWARKAAAYGHQPRLIHAPYVRPYVRRNKTDSADADALLRANQDQELKPVPVKDEHRQALQGLHRIRSQYDKTRKQRINLVRGLLAEFGLSLPRTTSRFASLLGEQTEPLPEMLRQSLLPVVEEIADLEQRLKGIERQLAAIGKHDPVVQRLMTIPGIGLIIATAMAASVPNIYTFMHGRQFGAWLGITPREFSSGSTRRLGGITKKGDPYLRTLLIHGARSALLAAARTSEESRTELQRWALALKARSCHNTAAVALANKMARIIWCVWTREEQYQRR